MYDVTLKRGDTRHAIRAVLKDADGDPVNLTDCQVKFKMAPLSGPATISRAAHIQNAEKGEVWVVWVPGETDTSGIYRAEFQVTYPDGRRETFPYNGYISIQIMNDLGGRHCGV
ncbi:MAG: BppU family phage baseplate upper protein [Christensenellales bacterium]|jgi:FlaG/FlaF family flagellin (archaellin)